MARLLDKLQWRPLQVYLRHYRSAEIDISTIAVAYYLILTVFPLIVIAANVFPYLNIDTTDLLKFMNEHLPKQFYAPAANEAEDSGVVAIPHLSRDLLACYDGNGSNFGTHPQNVLRGMIYDTKTWEYPYLYNLIDQYRSLEKYNNGYAYNMMFVGPGWLNKMGRWEQPYELLKKSYEDGMKYYGDLKKEGKLTDMTMAEFADYYRQKKTYTEPECALWRDILYGSDK